MCEGTNTCYSRSISIYHNLHIYLNMKVIFKKNFSDLKKHPVRAVNERKQQSTHILEYLHKDNSE